MILEPGKWQGRGSYRPTDASLGLRFQATVEIDDDRRTEGLIVNATLQSEGGSARSIQVYVVPDEVGTYAVTVKGDRIDVQGTAKLDSEPHLGLLWSDDGTTHVTCTVFTLPETHGVRGFAKVGKDTWTWELALQPQHRVGRRPSALRSKDGKPDKAGKAEKRGNVVSLFDRLKR